MLYVSAEPGDRLFLGRAGENMARTIRLDIAPWRELYGDGIVALLLRRPGERDPYPCVIGTEGSTVIWPITLAETERPGTTGQYELQYRVGDQLVKSAHGGVTVYDALGQPGEEPPEPQRGWVDQVLEAGAKAEAAVGDAGKQAAAAEASAARAEAAAGDAEKQAAAAETSAAETVEAAIYAGKQAAAAEASAKEAEAAAGETVRYTPQELTVEQQAQARKNIDTLKVVTVKYWNNGGVDDAVELFWAARGANGNGLFVCYAEDKNFPYPAPLRMYSCWSDGGQAGCTVQASDGCEYNCYMRPDGLEIEDERYRYVMEVNGQRGSVKTVWYAWIMKDKDGTYKSNQSSTKLRSALNSGASVYAELGSEIAHLRDVDAAQNTVTFDLPIVHDTSGYEGVYRYRTIKVDGNAATVTEDVLPDSETLLKSFPSMAQNQKITDLDALTYLAQNTTMHLSARIELTGDGTEAAPFSAHVVFANQEWDGMKENTCIGVVSMALAENVAYVELMWRPMKQTYRLLRFEGVVYEGKTAVVTFANSEWRVTMTYVQDDEGNETVTFAATEI